MNRKDKYAARDGFPRFFRASAELQQKIGTNGTVDTATIERMQGYLDAVKIDVIPLLRERLDTIDERVASTRGIAYEREEFLNGILRPLMDVKSISGMFHWPTVSRLSGFVLTFIEDVRRLDNNVLDIVDAHNRSVRLLLDRGTPQGGETHATAFLTEIRNATRRYYEKYASAVR